MKGGSVRRKQKAVQMIAGMPFSLVTSRETPSRTSQSSNAPQGTNWGTLQCRFRHTSHSSVLQLCLGRCWAVWVLLQFILAEGQRYLSDFLWYIAVGDGNIWLESCNRTQQLKIPLRTREQCGVCSWSANITTALAVWIWWLLQDCLLDCYQKSSFSWKSVSPILLSPQRKVSVRPLLLDPDTLHKHQHL